MLYLHFNWSLDLRSDPVLETGIRSWLSTSFLVIEPKSRRLTDLIAKCGPWTEVY